MAPNPRLTSFIGLVALLPVAAYMLSDSIVVALSLVCVLLIVGSLYVMFGPAEAAHDPHDAHDADATHAR